MKKAFIALTLMTMCLVCCTDNKQERNEFTTDSLTYKKESDIANVNIKVKFPQTTNRTLFNALAEYISEEMGGTYEGDMSDGNAMLAFYGDTYYKGLEDDAKEIGAEGMPALDYSQSIDVDYETDKYVTYISDTYTFMGGAHGISTKQGSTFRKSDGKRFSYEMLQGTDRAEFKQLIKKGVISYFAGFDVVIDSDESLAEMLITDADVNFLPLPQFAPYLTKEGVTFIYQQYEIAPYAAGMPNFTISYSDILPYMTTTAKNYIENQ